MSAPTILWRVRFALGFANRIMRVSSVPTVTIKLHPLKLPYWFRWLRWGWASSEQATPDPGDDPVEMGEDEATYTMEDA